MFWLYNEYLASNKMDWTPNIEDLKVLKQAFQCSDFDGDGFVR